MSKNRQFNSFALLAKEGCKDSKNKIFTAFIPIIIAESNKIWHIVRDQTAFEQECYRQIEYAINKFDENKIDSFYNLVISSIRRLRNKYINKKHRIAANISLVALAGGDDDETEYQVVDECANVENEVCTKLTLKEKITLLAEGDAKKKTILSAWLMGYNDTEISEILANLMGGKSSTHRVYISRFKNKCRKQLGGVA